MKSHFLISCILISTCCFSQGEITISHVYQSEDFVSVSLSMDKPTSKFELIDIDTMTVTDHKGNQLVENRASPLNYNYNNGRSKALRYYPSKKKIKDVHISGVINYFVPSKKDGSYFNLGENGSIPRNVNLVDKKLLEKNPNLYFGLVDSTQINALFPDFSYRKKDDEPYKKIDFSSFDLIYAYRYPAAQKLVFFIDNDPMPGDTRMTLKHRATGIMYVLTKFNKKMTSSERDKIPVEIMIENEASIKKIPFSFDNVPVKSL